MADAEALVFVLGLKDLRFHCRGERQGSCGCLKRHGTSKFVAGGVCLVPPDRPEVIADSMLRLEQSPTDGEL